MSEVVAEYSPNTEWGKQHVEVTLKQWAYSATHVVQIGGNCRGFDVLEAAIGRVYDLACEDVPDGYAPRLTLTAPHGGTLLCEDDEDGGEDWIKEMAVSVRIVGYDPPTLNEVRARNGAPPVPDGDRPHPPL
jgi:hypothetical protein